MSCGRASRRLLQTTWLGWRYSYHRTFITVFTDSSSTVIPFVLVSKAYSVISLLFLVITTLTNCNADDDHDHEPQLVDYDLPLHV